MDGGDSNAVEIPVYEARMMQSPLAFLSLSKV